MVAVTFRKNPKNLQVAIDMFNHTAKLLSDDSPAIDLEISEHLSAFLPEFDYWHEVLQPPDTPYRLKAR